MDIRKIRKLIELIDETGVAEIEIHEGEESVRINRYGPVASAPHMVMHMPAAPTTTAMQPSISPQETAKIEQSTPAKPQHTINSPMVGTFYSAPSPGAKSFVEIGQKVKAGDVLCI